MDQHGLRISAYADFAASRLGSDLGQIGAVIADLRLIADAIRHPRNQSHESRAGPELVVHHEAHVDTRSVHRPDVLVPD